MLTNNTVCNQYINNVPQIISVKQISLKDRFQGGMDMLEGTVRSLHSGSFLGLYFVVTGGLFPCCP